VHGNHIRVANSFRHPDVVDFPGAIEAWWRDFRNAAGFLTCLPIATTEMPAGAAADEAVTAAATTAPAAAPVTPAIAALRRATALFPLVGALIGLAAALALLTTFELGLHPLACAMVALAVAAALTGALHEDGLADFADGLGGGRGDRQRRLAIMRDSRIGTAGTLAIVFGVGIRAAILSGLLSPEAAAASVVAAAAVSRAVLPGVMRWQKPARDDGLAAVIGAPRYACVIVAAGLGLIIAWIAVGLWAGLLVVGVAALAALAVAAVADRTLGGQTGDVLGAVQVVAEIAVLAAIAAVE
jgi:adenosylcobinamide-GDP ribazoletransferase